MALLFTVTKIRHASGECMSCGMTGTMYDVDGADFCNVFCIEDWHGVNRNDMRIVDSMGREVKRAFKSRPAEVKGE